MSEGKIVIGDLKYLIERLRLDAKSYFTPATLIEVLQIRQHTIHANTVVIKWRGDTEGTADHHIAKSLIELTGDL